MKDNKRAADDAVSREEILTWAALAGIDDMMSESRIAMLADFATFARAALSGCADGGKGEAVAVAFIEGDDVQRVLRWNKDVAAFNYEIGTSLYTAPQAECAPITPRADADTAGAHIASVYEDKDGTKYVQFDIEDAEDIPIGTKLYPGARTLTRQEIEEIAGYVEDECKACSGMTSLYVAAEAAVEETLMRLAIPVPSDEYFDAVDTEIDAMLKPAAGASNERADAEKDAARFIYDDVCDERLRQDQKWGGDAHDDTHTNSDWMDYIWHQMYRWREEVKSNDPSASPRQRFVKIAALAVAAMASIDRKDAAIREEWDAFMLDVADGGKGEAVYQLDSGDGNWVDVAQESYEGHALVGDVRFRRKLYTAPQAECAPIAPRADADTANIYERFDTWMKGPHARVQTMLDAFAAGASNERADADTAGAHIASIYADADGTKHVQLDVEDIDDIPVGTKLYLPAPTLTRAEIEEIAGYAENEGKACGISSLYIAAETAIEETLRRLAAPPASQERADTEKDAALDEVRLTLLIEDNIDYGGRVDSLLLARAILAAKEKK